MPDTEIKTIQRETEMDPLKIERALSDLWKEYSTTSHEGGPAARARLANLIVYCRSNAEAEAASDAIAKLNAVRPVRSIVVVAEGGGGTDEAAVAIKCADGVNGSVCYEEIGLHTAGESVRALPALLEPLTVPDLPVYLWFPGDPALDDPEVRRLIPLADRVVTDSHQFSDTLLRFRQLNDLVREFRGQCVFTEMTWTRLGTWREAVGKLFDPMPTREFLPKVREVVITSVHGASEPSDRAVLMTGWLASKLNWHPTGLQAERPPKALFQSAYGAVEVTWTEGPATARGHLLSVELRAGEEVMFKVLRQHGDPSGAIKSSIVCTGEEAFGPAYHPLHWQTSELLCNALEIRSPFQDWEDALAVVADLQGQQK